MYMYVKNKKKIQTQNRQPFLIDIQYNDKIRFNDNLTVMKPLLKR